jgi:hypothetical protein
MELAKLHSCGCIILNITRKIILISLPIGLLLNSEDGVGTFLRNVGKNLKHTASRLKIHHIYWLHRENQVNLCSHGCCYENITVSGT